MSAAAARPKAPPGTFWRGRVLWGRVAINGRRAAWTLATGDPVEAERRFAATAAAIRDPVGANEAKRRLLAGEPLTEAQALFAAAAVGLTIERAGRRGPK